MFRRLPSRHHQRQKARECQLSRIVPLPRVLDGSHILSAGAEKSPARGEDSLKVRVPAADTDGMRNLAVATFVGLVSFLVGGAPTAVGAVLVVAPLAVAFLPARR